LAPEQPGMVIVGAGECGARAALALREQGYAGPVTLVGAERHHPYERPPLSKGTLDHRAEPAPKSIASPAHFAERRITLLAPAEAVAIDRVRRVLQLGDGATLPYEKLLLATGAVPRLLPMAAGLRRCVALRTFDDALAIRAHLGPGRRLAVIGGGFIGLELAAAARQAGAAVSVVETQGRILQRGVPAEIAAVIHERHASAGVRIFCGAAISSIIDTGEGVELYLSDGGCVAADLAVIGIGAVPNAALAEAAGLAVDNGVAVDTHLRTSDPHILAAGDCCSFPLSIYGGRRVRLEAWRNAQEQGTLVAINMLGRDDHHVAVPWFWSDQYELGLQVAGLADEATDTVRRDIGKDAFLLFHLAADGRLVAASGIGPGNAVARDIRLAEMLIARRAYPPRDQLAAAGTKLKALLPADPQKAVA
jgi:3-phenylpropionate/trans-cinnamate dioxygenase ferredoxin reductase subunit